MAKPYRWQEDSSAEPFREWHRGWGRSLYATDVDFVEYTFRRGVPEVVGYFEYKHINAAPIGRRNPQVAVLADAASKVQVPGFFVRYTTETPITFKVYPLNSYAKEWTKTDSGLLLPECRYATMLHVIRKEKIADSLKEKLSSETADVTFPVDRPPFINNHRSTTGNGTTVIVNYPLMLPDDLDTSHG
jgi:hypothetical protein